MATGKATGVSGLSAATTIDHPPEDEAGAEAGEGAEPEFGGHLVGQLCNRRPSDLRIPSDGCAQLFLHETSPALI